MIEIPRCLIGNNHYRIDDEGDYIMVDGAPGYSEQHYKLYNTANGKYETVSYKRLTRKEATCKQL